jgi:hypothetical protein
VFDILDEAPRSELRGIKAELRRSLTRLRSEELRRGSPYLSSLKQAAGYSGEGESNLLLFRSFSCQSSQLKDCINDSSVDYLILTS